MALRALNLCDGYGGFELAFRHARIPIRTVARVERESYAASVLVERMGEARLDDCPVWDDLETFDGAAWRGRVDLVCAGFPCPDFSAAGQRAGVDGEHWLWPEVEQIISDVGPRWVVLENVPGLVRLGGATRVLSGLAHLGFDAEWGVFGAGDIGAPHERKRWWCVARLADTSSSRRGKRLDGALVPRFPTDAETGSADHVADTDGNGFRRVGWQSEHDGYARNHVDGRNGTHVGDANGQLPGRGVTSEGVAAQDRSQHQPGHHDARPSSEDVGHATGVDEREPHYTSRADARGDARGDACRSRQCVADTEDNRQSATDTLRFDASFSWPPYRDDADGWRRWIVAGGPQPVVRRGADGPPLGLADALHLGGNGLVPQCAAAAIRLLLDRAGWVME